MAAPSMTVTGSKLCLFCCYSFTPPRGSRMLHFVEYRNRQLQKFFEGFLLPRRSSSGPGQRSKSSLTSVVSVDKRECLQLGGGGDGGNKNKSFEGLSICNDCLSMILIITEGKGRVERVEEQIRLLQRQGIREMDRLSKEMGRLEELMEGGDTACLEGAVEEIQGPVPSSSSGPGGGNREVVVLRESILKAAKKLQTYNSNLCRKISGHGALCGCGANINPPTYTSVAVPPPPSVIVPNSGAFEEDHDPDLDPAEFGDPLMEDVDVKPFDKGYQNYSPAPSPLPDSASPSASHFGFSEDGSDDDGSRSRNIMVQNKAGRPGERSQLVLKLLKKARQHHRVHQYQSLGQDRDQPAIGGRPRDSIRNEFDMTESGRAKCRRCGRSVCFRVDVMKSHKRACLRAMTEPGPSLGDIQDDHHGGRQNPEGQSKLGSNSTPLKTRKARTPRSGSTLVGRPKDSIRNEFDRTESGKAKCRVCGRCICYRVDTMKSHKLACIRALMKTPNPLRDGIRESLYPEGRPELELNETTGKMRKPRWRRRTPGTEPSNTGRPRDSIRDEFELNDDGKVKCKGCNSPVTNRVDLMKSHRLRCPSNEANCGPEGNKKTKRKIPLELDEETGEWKPKRKCGPKHDTPGRPKDFIWHEFDRAEMGKARCRGCGRLVSSRVDLLKNHKLRCSQINTSTKSEIPECQKLELEVLN